MARNLAGADYVITGIGGLVGIGSSGHTLLAICRRAANGAWHTPISIETSGNSSKLAMQFSDTNRIQLIIGSSNKDTTVGITSSDNWVLAAATRASGSSVPRGHKFVYDTNTWTHTDAGAASGGDSTDLTGGRVQIGRWQTTDFFNGDILLVGAFKRALTDSELESLPFTLLGAAAAAPDGLWLLDQHATTQAIIDLTGNGANQTSLTNTSVATNSAPLWSYGLGASVVVGRSGGGTTHSADAAVTATATTTAAAAVDRAATAAASTTATVTAAATVDRQAVASTTATAATAAGAAVDRTAAASLAVTATLAATADVLSPSDATGALTATATATATAAVDRAAQAVMTAVASLTATAAVATPGTDPVRATSTAAVTAAVDSTSAVTADRTSTSAVTARATSSGGVV